MDMTPSVRPARRSLLTAWTVRHEGPAWAPWAWTAAFNVLVAALLTVFVPATAGFGPNLLISQAIGLSIHGGFAGLSRWLKLDMFALPLPVRVAYVVSVVLAGSWLGYTAAMALMLRDADALMAHMTRASPFLLKIPTVWALVTTAMFAGIHRFRAQQMARERERSERIQAQREAAEARLALLNAQIEPHFLYNTLASVSALVEDDGRAARRLLDALVAYLRASARNMSRLLVPLCDELESVRGYLAVMQQRLGPRLQVAIDVPAEAASLLLPPASLQTLVENAIKHGIEPSVRGGEICVSATRREQGWCLAVADGGAGLRDVPATVGGTGLANLSERLRLALGAQARVTLRQRDGGGVVAEILVPGAPPTGSNRAPVHGGGQ